MKSFESLAQQIDQWWQKYLKGASHKNFGGGMPTPLDQVGKEMEHSGTGPEQTSDRSSTSGSEKQLYGTWRNFFKPQLSQRQIKQGDVTQDSLLPGASQLNLIQQKLHQKNACQGKPSRSGSRSPVLLVLAVISLTSVMGHRFYNEPKLDVGTLAPQTLRAPESANIEDTEVTEERRKAARTGAVTILMVNETANQEIYQSLQRSLEQGSEIRQLAGPFPFTETWILSTPAQQYLRQAEEWEWRAILEATKDADAIESLEGTSSGFTGRVYPATLFSSVQRRTISELRLYRLTATAQDFSELRNAIAQTRQRYAVARARLSSSPGGGSGSLYDASLLNLSDDEWRKTKLEVQQALRRIVTQGIPPGLPSTIVQSAADVQLSGDIPTAARPLARRLLVAIAKPNLVADLEQTKLRAEQAAKAVEPEIVSIQQGEVIVQAGEAITRPDFVVLDHFNLSRRGINWIGLIGFGSLVSGGIAVFLVMERRFHPNFRLRDHILLTLLALTTPILAVVGIPATSLPAVGLLVGSFYGSILGATVVGLLSVVLPIGTEIAGRSLLASWAAGLVGGLVAGRMRSREELALLGGVVGLTQGVVYLVLSAAVSPLWYTMLPAAALQSLAGFAWSVVALGLSPYLEHLFDLVTPIRLAELSNPNRPLLKRLASEAPGTFQHTLFVSTLAEAAARELSCNVELVRAGTLYHDIGKMHDPKGFIENQMGGPNKHDTINNPWKSAEIIKKHVTEGLVMARKHRLPTAVQAFIPEHQGAMLIAFFHHQAQQQAHENVNLVVNDSDFRYDGPIPQSRETGIVMLADSCEAALRSLKDATHEDALMMVNKILRARWQDNQLEDSGLTREDMAKIAEIFVQVWQQFNHQRIPYPKAVVSTNRE